MGKRLIVIVGKHRNPNKGIGKRGWIGYLQNNTTIADNDVAIARIGCNGNYILEKADLPSQRIRDKPTLLRMRVIS